MTVDASLTGKGEVTAVAAVGGVGGEPAPPPRYIRLHCPACGNSVTVLEGCTASDGNRRHSPMEMTK